MGRDQAPYSGIVGLLFTVGVMLAMMALLWS